MKKGEEYHTNQLAAERAPENRCLAVVDGRGYVTSLRVLSAAEPSMAFFQFMREQQRVAAPLERADIVLPDESWELDENNRATKLVRDEHGGIVARLTTETVILEPIRRTT